MPLQVAMQLSALGKIGTGETRQSTSSFLQDLWAEYQAEQWALGNLHFIPPTFASNRLLEFMQFVQFVIAVDVSSNAVYCYPEGDFASAQEVAPTMSGFLDALAFLTSRISDLPKDFDSRRADDCRQLQAVYAEVLELVGTGADSEAGQFWSNLA